MLLSQQECGEDSVHSKDFFDVLMEPGFSCVSHAVHLTTT